MGKGHKAVSLPYKGAQLSMLVVMPEAVDGLGGLESSLTVDGLDAIVKALAPREVALALPKLEVNPAASMPLADLLKAAGMASAFDPAKADFLAMANPKDPRDRLCIGNVFHKAFVKVDEKGTEAAAATSVQMLRVGSMVPPKPPEPFEVDRPFLFFIRDEATGLVIFMGRVQDPTTR
jgi:serpin B